MAIQIHQLTLPNKQGPKVGYQMDNAEVYRGPREFAAVLGLAAAKRGLTAVARAQQAAIEKTFAANRPMITIDELGFYQRAKSVLEGRQDI